MKKTKSRRFVATISCPSSLGIAQKILIFLIIFIGCVGSAYAVDLTIMKTGSGSGTIISNPAGINCGSTCTATFATGALVTLTATPNAGSVFIGWEGDALGESSSISVTMSGNRSVRAVFVIKLTDITITPEGIRDYLSLIANASVNTPARFLKALPEKYKQNWILMSRSESLQTGTAEFPRVILPSEDAKNVFTIALATHGSYPGSHPNAIEYMQWDQTQKNFRLHEIVLAAIPAMGVFRDRIRGISFDDAKCTKCHSTGNVLNRSIFPGTMGLPPPGFIKAKNKPNWDAYDSWGGMMPFNRDRIYQGSIEEAAFRKLFNLWGWRSNDGVRSVIEQLYLQPPGLPSEYDITRTNSGTSGEQINFPYPLPAPGGAPPALPIQVSYAFNGVASNAATATDVTQGGAYIMLRHSNIPPPLFPPPAADEGRAVRFFDALGGLAGTLNQQRIADDLINHSFATGSAPINIRALALAITDGLLTRDSTTNTVVINATGMPPLSINLNFFNDRNGMSINDLYEDTKKRAFSLPRRKADIQKINLDRTTDEYLATGAPANGLIQEYGAGTSTLVERLRREIFQRPYEGIGFPDRTGFMGGYYIDREFESNIEKVTLFRYFLEPLGVSVDKWSMSVRSRSLTYTFADVFGTYLNIFSSELKASLGLPNASLSSTAQTQLITTINAMPLPLPAAVPTFTDIQRIFNKHCIACHGGLNYPPYSNRGTLFDFSENEEPTGLQTRLSNSHSLASAYANLIYQKITQINEGDCTISLMPAGGPPLSKTDILTVRRWIDGGKPATDGDPHITTVDGVHYDFQAAGEFVLLRDENFELQARHTAVASATPVGPDAHTGLTSCVSVNSAVAIKIGRNRITYQPNLSKKRDSSGLELRVDGELKQLGAQGIALSSGGRIMPTIAPNGIQIEAPGGMVIVITSGWWDYYQLWYLNIDTRHVRATQGLMGTIAPNNWLPALPDGSFMGAQPKDLQQRFKDLYEKFGKAWRVNDATTLFDYAPNTSTKTFTIENWPFSESSQSCLVQKGKLPMAGVTLAEAEQLCSGIVDRVRRLNCIHDVMATGNREFAKTYLLAEQITRNSPPTAPILVAPENFKTQLALPITFSWNKSTDADGDAISYRLSVWGVDKMSNNNEAVPVSLGIGISCPLLIGILGCILWLILYFMGLKGKPLLMILLAIAVLAAVIIAYYKWGSSTLSKTVNNLESGKVYFWKVIAEDNKGGASESETWRFEVK
jgi:mono/diheme cytochrome c family protein